jgi:hypothetical protein
MIGPASHADPSCPHGLDLAVVARFKVLIRVAGLSVDLAC